MGAPFRAKEHFQSFQVHLVGGAVGVGGEVPVAPPSDGFVLLPTHWSNPGSHTPLPTLGAGPSKEARGGHLPRL